MKIAIDIDGTIYETEKEMRVEAEIYDIEELHGNGMIDKSQVWAQDRYDWTDEQNIKFISKFVEITQRANLLPGAKEIIKKFEKMGIDLIIITARGNQDYENNEQMMQVAKDKLKSDGLHFTKMIFKTPNKLQTCLDEKVDFLIDDSPNVCQETIDGKVKTIFIRDAEIKKVDRPNEYLYEVGNWGEIYRIVYNYVHNDYKNVN